MTNDRGDIIDSAYLVQYKTLPESVVHNYECLVIQDAVSAAVAHHTLQICLVLFLVCIQKDTAKQQ